MATNAAKTSLDLDALFTQLRSRSIFPDQVARHPQTQDGSRGAVIATRTTGLHRRLNQLFTPSGWTRNYDVTAVSAVSRQKRDKIIQTVSVSHLYADDRASWNSLRSGEQWQMSRMR